MDGYITLKEAAVRYGYASARALRQAAHAGTLAAEKIGATWLISEAALDAYMLGSGRMGRPRGAVKAQHKEEPAP